MVKVGVLRSHWYAVPVGRRFDTSSGVNGVDGGPPRSRLARLRTFHYRGWSGLATVVLASLITYDGRHLSAPVTSPSAGRYAVPLTIHRVCYVAPTAEVLPSLISKAHHACALI